MKADLVKLPHKKPFVVRCDTRPDINNRWHYHEDIELVYVKHGSGTLFVGDGQYYFASESCYLIGSNIPHYWKFEEKYFQKASQKIEVYVVHFSPQLGGQEFLTISENYELKRFLMEASRGYQVLHDIDLVENISQLYCSEGFMKLIKLLQLIYLISKQENKKFLVNEGYHFKISDIEKNRLQDIYHYTLHHFTERIELNTIAKIAKMTPQSFCKYFKKKNNKTYTEFVNELRVGEACKLLMDHKLSIKEICFDSGFNNFSSFHQCFKNITGKTPSQYQKDLA